MPASDAAIKAALIGTTNTPGWLYVKQLANAAVQKAVQAALDADDREKGEMLRLKAKAMQQGMQELFASIEAYRNWESGLDSNLDVEQIETDLEELARANG